MNTIKLCGSSLVALALLAAAVAPLAAASGSTLQIGQPAPDFELPGVDGKTYSLRDFAGARVLVIVFTCNHCPTAQAYEDRIQQLARDTSDRGVALVAISPNDPQAVRLDELGYTDVGDSLEDMKVRARQRNFDFPYLYDGETQAVSRAYGPVATPHVFVFDRQRKLRYRGRVDDSAKPGNVSSHDARAAIDALLAGKPVTVPETRTFGCSIKWSDKRQSAAESLARWDRETAESETIDKAGVADLVTNDSQRYRLINVWATWCGPCKAEFPELVTIHRMYRKRDFELITICASPEQEDAAVQAFLNEQHASCRNYRFRGKNEYELMESLDPEWQGALPYTLLVAPGGKIVYRKQGPIEPLEIRGVIVDHIGRVYR